MKLTKAQAEFLAMLTTAGGVIVFEGANGSQRTINALWDKKLISVSIEHAPHINIYTVRLP
jgi:hypothetical protein